MLLGRAQWRQSGLEWLRLNCILRVGEAGLAGQQQVGLLELGVGG